MSEFVVEIFVNYVIPLTYLLIGICALSIVIGFIMSCFSKPKIFVRSLISLTIVAVIFMVGYTLSDAVTFANVKSVAAVSPGTIRGIGAALIMTYIMIVLGILGIIVNWITNLIK